MDDDGQPYEPSAIEPRWQARWRDEGTYEVDNDDPRPPSYVLCMYPYPSGPAHMGHVRNYTFGDLLVRYRTMNGHGRAVAHRLRQLRPAGRERGHQDRRAPPPVHRRPHRGADARRCSGSAPSYDWRREVKSHDPAYIRWTQWIFLRFLEAGLAYRDEAPVNWCPGCQTVLANEQVLADGTCERSGDLVEQARPRAVVLQDHRLRRAAARRPRRPRLARAGQDHAAQLDRPLRGRRVRPAGRRADGRPDASRVFTTRPDTSFGMTYAVVAPEHPLVAELTTDDQRAEVEAFVAQVTGRERDRAPVARRAALDKRGVFTGAHAVNPFTGEPVPIYLADYVLMGYGTGAIMAVPGQDQRDWDFAKAYDLPIIRTVAAARGLGGRGLHGRRAGHQQRVAGRPGRGRGHGARPSTGWRSRASASARSTTACATGCCPASASGAARSRSSTATTAASSRCPTTDLPVLAPDDVEFRPDR